MTDVTESARSRVSAQSSSLADTDASKPGAAGLQETGDESWVPEKRKRGRPRRPKPDVPVQPLVKRPRGRPPGSKNKTPSKAALLGDLGDSGRAVAECSTKNYSPQKRRPSRPGLRGCEPAEFEAPQATGTAEAEQGSQ